MTDPKAFSTSDHEPRGGRRARWSTAIAAGAATGLALFTGLVSAGTPPVLEMHWPMEPWTSDDVTLLESGVGGSGDLVGFPGDGSEWTLGVLGRALVFDGVDEHVAHDASLPRNEGTLGHWLRPASATGARVAVYESDFSGAALPDYNGFSAAGNALEIHTGIVDGDFYALWQDGSATDRREVQGGTVVADEWVHVALTWSIPGEMKLYVNCKLVDSAAMEAVFDGRTPTEHFIGKPSQFAGRHWPGAIDEVKVWDREFTAEGVRSHFCPVLEPESGVVRAPAPATGDRFGTSVALNQDWMLALSPGASEVSFFRRQGPSSLIFDSARPSAFTDSLAAGALPAARSLDVSGTLAAVAANNGVDVYELGPTGPVIETTLSVTIADNFGFAVAASGDRVAVGAPATDGGGIYVFERDEGGPGAWGTTFSETPGAFDPDKFLGRLVDMDGDLLAVHKQLASLPSTTDIVELFQRVEAGGIAGWAPAGGFGEGGDSIVSLGLRGDRIAVGVVDPSGDRGGQVFVRRRDQGGPDQWGIEHRFVASDGDRFDLLGASVAWLDDRTVAAVAVGTDRDHQAVYLFRIGGSTVKSQDTVLVQKTFDPVTEFAGAIGASLDAAGDLVVAGAPLTGPSLVQAPTFPGFSGRVHLFLPPLIFADGFESVVNVTR